MSGFLLRKDDYPNGIATPGDVQRLASLLNPYLTEVNSLESQSGVSLADNLSCEVQTGTLQHGVPSRFSLKRLKSAKGCLVLGCDSAIPVSLVMQPVTTTVTGALPQVLVTVWFNNPTASAKVSLLLLPEGQLTTSSVAFLAPILAQTLTTTGDLLFASAAATPARLGLGLSGQLLQAGTSAPQWGGDTAWTAPALTSIGNLGVGSANVAFSKDGAGFIHLRGAATSTAGTASGTTVFTLPVGYRPLANELFGVISAVGIARVDVQSGGAVVVQTTLTTGQFISFSGISFDTR